MIFYIRLETKLNLCLKQSALDAGLYHIEGVGEIKFTPRKSSRRLSMRLRPDGVVSVNYPWFASRSEVLNFIGSNSQWIAEQKSKLSEKSNAYSIGDQIETLFRTISIEQATQGKLRGVVQNKNVIVYIPPSRHCSDPVVIKYIQNVVVTVCRNDAKKYLPQRVATLAAQHGLSYNNVYLKNLKSKWGSCSSLKNINLNISLMRLPQHLSDYIILHELAHTVELNHSSKFWVLLDKLTSGKAKALNKEMKNYRDLVITNSKN